MPEGPSIVILKELVQRFKGKEIVKVEGNSTLDIQEIAGQTITDFKSWGKHFLICLTNFTVRIHFMLFGSYRINEQKETKPRLSLQFQEGQINFYTCSVQFITENLDEVYDWSSDVMSELWDAEKAKHKLKQQPDTLVCDALLDKRIFSGVGNIIKNEVLFRIRVHPESDAGALPEEVLEEMIKDARIYSFDFFEWKKNYVLKKHWLAHTKKICPRCNIPLIKKYAGTTKRRTFFCNNCQVLYKRI
ncbi:DNA-formamidopyrimidine glycosylase family protein [Segetibacter koreensis]|uniref:DNA-formamidopyrimidine glycosylase family protein n=1 Tax=Segetibacter koreensis TaxID=398037 RepID=UPI00037CA4D8|nr:DNA-formamidopyrimidine glycosylase family protein [Segetibacter koreensis]